MTYNVFGGTLNLAQSNPVTVLDCGACIVCLPNETKIVPRLFICQTEDVQLYLAKFYYRPWLVCPSDLSRYLSPSYCLF